MTVPYTFGSATAPIPLSQLDSNFATAITLGNTSIQLGNTVTTLNNMTLANVTISSGTSNIAVTSIANGTSNVTIASSGGAVNIATNGTQALTIDTSQRVLIGTTSTPTGGGVNLDIVGQGSSDGGIQITSGTGVSGGGIAIISNATGGGKFYSFTGNTGSETYTERMRIDSSGNLLVGTTTAVGGTSRLSLKGVALQAAGTIQVGTDGYPGLDFRNVAGAQQGYIQINTASVAYTSVSDYRLKENIQPMTGALTKVAQLKPVTYKWKVDGSDGQGFIAHELQEVVPDCVSGEKDEVDADGNPKYQGIDTSFLVATLTAALQEQQALIQTLQTQVAQLQEKVGV